MIVTTVDIAIRDRTPIESHCEVVTIPEVGLMVHVKIGGLGQTALALTTAHPDRLEELGDALVAAAQELRMRQRIQAGAA